MIDLVPARLQLNNQIKSNHECCGLDQITLYDKAKAKTLIYMIMLSCAANTMRAGSVTLHDRFHQGSE